jgi:hypothetical protein
VSTRGDRALESGGLLCVRLHCALAERTAEVCVEHSGATTSTHITSSDGLDAGGIMATPHPDLYALVGRELQEAGADLIYADAVSHGVRLAEVAESR